MNESFGNLLHQIIYRDLSCFLSLALYFTDRNEAYPSVDNEIRTHTPRLLIVGVRRDLNTSSQTHRPSMEGAEDL